MLQEITLRPMAESDLPGAFALSQQVGWPHRLDDWRQAWRLGEGVVAMKAGKVIGSTLCWRWGATRATIGLVIVDRASQGQGIGKRLMTTLLSSLKGYHVRLNATAEGRALYSGLGFNKIGTVYQHQSRALPAIAPLPLAPGCHLRMADQADREMLLALDSAANGVHRPALLQALLNEGENTQLLMRDDRPLGFASVRRFGHGYTIGPVVADTVESAQCLINHLLLPLSGQFVRIDVDARSGLSEGLITAGLLQVDAPVAMIRGTQFTPQAAQPRGFALVSQAMG
ncbi:GNAT family N-acetyltransferase [Serratia sp. NPDC078593]|uniref:GNAT family N-acetyltransferase n=1 Tax=unclassified Serratia (in: enterobacteria) TaxID=2647522 RepID=UPI0037D75AEC